MYPSYLFLADGFEEIEALTTVDVLRRGGVDVRTVSIMDSLDVEGAHGVTVKADMHFADADFEHCCWLILPGGMPGAANLAGYEPLGRLLRRHAAGGDIAAICAAPAVVLAPLGLLDGRDATCYPGFEDKLTGANSVAERVVVDRQGGRIVTANGPASAMSFALTILDETQGRETSRTVGEGLLIYPKAEDFFFG